MIDNELKPCPFCGFKGVIVEIKYHDFDVVYYHVECLDCGAETHNFRCVTKEEAIEVWNRRSDE